MTHLPIGRGLFSRALKCAVGFIVSVTIVGGAGNGVSRAASIDPVPAAVEAYPVVDARTEAQARRGNARAQTMLGLAYATGRGVPQNYRLAVKWYRRAAEHGNATAQYFLGLMYDHGQGVPENKVIAHKWLILAVAGASGAERDNFARIRDAVASTLTVRQVAKAQYLAYRWTLRHRHRIPRRRAR